MNTPAHVILSCVAVPHKPGWPATSALVVGALLPDVPMFGFYAYQKIVGRTEKEIWGQLYFEPSWQLLFDWFNSLPLAAVIIALSWWFGWQWSLLCATSAALHMLCDLPLHHDDAHRHLLPLTNWRFISPVSYWDFNHYGRWTLPTELLLTLAGCLYLLLPGQSTPLRIVGGGTLAVYTAFACFAFAVWSGLASPGSPKEEMNHPRETASDVGTSASNTP